MSSPQPFLPSSAPSSAHRRKSAFTYKHLSQLSSYSPTTPLRVIAHVDLDAFYAQCEQVRLQLPPDVPLAVQQWQGLIAINYPARAFGLGRHITSTEAKKLCPELIMQHVATWKEGDETWAYHEDAAKHIATHKVSLDPYRRESRKILGVIRSALPAGAGQRVEKASVDEVFMDLSAQVHGILLERYPELQGPPPYDDPTELLPRPPTTALEWKGDALVDLDRGEEEEDDPDWDDVAICVGSEIVRDVRARVWEELRYTCSGGVARNKMLAKLGSGHKKPNAQTVIRNRAVGHFLSGFKFTKIRNLGGKLGDEVVAMFNTDSVGDLLKQPLEQLMRLGDDTGSWLYGIIRGEDNSEVNPRTQIKSMLSAKSFRPAINDFEQGVRWLRIFAADIFSRCVEEGVLENKRKPKTINLHHRQGAQTRSKQAPIPQGKTLTEQILFDLAKNLLAQVVVDGRAWPCINLSLSVGGWEDGIANNKGISAFLVRGEEAKALRESERQSDAAIERRDERPPEKRRKLENGRSIQKFFAPRLPNHTSTSSDADGTPNPNRLSERRESEDQDMFDSDPEPEHHLDSDTELPDIQQQPPLSPNRPSTPQPHLADLTSDLTPPSAQPQPRSPHVHPSHQVQQTLDTFFCSRCSTALPKEEETEHADWHFAKDLARDLEAEERVEAERRRTPIPAKPVPPRPQARGRGRPAGGGGSGSGSAGAGRGAEKGQRRLAFGKG
ncbi:DNA/RNA polymerase [Lophium mytilinum]|uniref:DNA polymerase eta n=1 Tax=Lophium mytilinum TaxID=390894 RepID=A0A6A6QKS9_9PEZI|nr:DNA/RNA polymerase [Lophium mytilinum]